MKIITVTYDLQYMSFYSGLKTVDFGLLVSSETEYEEHCATNPNIFRYLNIAKQRGKVVHFNTN